MSILIWRSIYYSTTVYHIILPRIIPYHITPCRIIMSHFYHSSVHISVCNIDVCRIYMESIMYDDGGVCPIYLCSIYLNHKRSSKEEEDSTSILKCPVMAETWGPDFHAEGRGQELTWAGGWWHAHLEKNSKPKANPKEYIQTQSIGKKIIDSTKSSFQGLCGLGLLVWYFSERSRVGPMTKTHSPRPTPQKWRWQLAHCQLCSEWPRKKPPKKKRRPTMKHVMHQNRTLKWYLNSVNIK